MIMGHDCSSQTGNASYFGRPDKVLCIFFLIDPHTEQGIVLIQKCFAVVFRIKPALNRSRPVNIVGRYIFSGCLEGNLPFFNRFDKSPKAGESCAKYSFSLISLLCPYATSATSSSHSSSGRSKRMRKLFVRSKICFRFPFQWLPSHLPRFFRADQITAVNQLIRPLADKRLFVQKSDTEQ